MSDRRSLSRRYSSTALISAVAVTVVSIAVSLHLLLPDIEGMNPILSLMIETGGLAAGTATALWFMIIRPLRDAAGREDFETMLHRALEMAGDEQAAYRSIDRTLDRGVGRLAVELLLADSSDAHLKRAVESGPEGRGSGCAEDRPAIALRCAARKPSCSAQATRSTPALTSKAAKLASALRCACPSVWQGEVLACCTRHPPSRLLQPRTRSGDS